MRNSYLRLYIPVYTATLILSAFLLFGIQPLYGKMILPLLGGSPHVWNTAMLFFQTMLLGGYAYAHATSRFLPVRVQAPLHIGLMMGAALLLPIALPAGWTPPESSNPALWQLGTMTISVGAPFFILAASAPIIQHWFSKTDHPHAQNPYFLYAASNLGSMSALLAYPFIIEPVLSLTDQRLGWAGGFFILLVCFMVCAALVLPHARANDPLARPAAPSPKVTSGLRLSWIVLSFIPSSLMLGVTTFITTDLAAVPMLWLMPLTLYVGTFIIVFSRHMRLSPRIIMPLYTILLIAVMLNIPANYVSNMPVEIAMHLGLFFTAALLCHQRLADLRPAPAHLTEFYLLMSVGGVLGGVFNALLAPALFAVPIEYGLILGLSAFVRYAGHARHSWPQAGEWWAYAQKNCLSLSVVAAAGIASVALYDIKDLRLIAVIVACAFMVALWQRRGAFALAATITLLAHPGIPWQASHDLLYMHRNYFGVMRVTDAPHSLSRNLQHGTTIHGAQPLPEAYRMMPISYYHLKGPIGDMFRALDARAPGPQRIGVLGLGIGSVACYTRPMRFFDFYEIDPAVRAIAENRDYFTYLSDCGSPYNVIIGDARLKIEHAPDQSYDLIIMDAFSSDNIPVHIITREALALYKQKLKPDGAIMVNISNRYLDLRPVLDKLQAEIGMTLFFRDGPAEIIIDENDSESGERRLLRSYRSLYGAFTNDPDLHDQLLGGDWEILHYDGRNHLRVWTDDYASPFGVLWNNSPKPSKN